MDNSQKYSQQNNSEINEGHNQAQNQQQQLDNGSENYSDQNSQENYELIPRDNQYYPLRKDTPIEYYSKPFVYQNHLNIQQNRQNRLNSGGSSHVTNKTLQDMNMKEIQSQNQQSISKQQKQGNLSFVSNSSSKNNQTEKQTEKLDEIVKFEYQSNILQKQTNKSRQRILQNQQRKLQKQNYQSQQKRTLHFNGRKVVSIQTNQQSQAQSPILKKLSQQISKKNISISSNQLKFKEEINFSFNPKYEYEINHIQGNENKLDRPLENSDPFMKYKKSAQNSPILINKQSSVSIQKHIQFQLPNNGVNQDSNKITTHHFQKKTHYSYQNASNPPPTLSQLQLQNKKYQQQLIKSQKQLIKNITQIDNLKKDLIKSTQNNINAIFNTTLTQQCCITSTIKGLQNKVNDLCVKIERMENKRIENLEREVFERNKREYEREEQQLAYKRQRQRQNYNNNQNNRNGNMILDLGNSNNNQGKIIAIYPNNKAVSIKQLMFNQNNINNHHSSNQQRSQQQQQFNSHKSLKSLQQSFLQTLKTYQQQIDLTLDKKLFQIQKQIQIQKIQLLKANHHDNQQKYSRISQESTDHDQSYDDSRGSINVIYIRKLREMEEVIQQKQYKIERLEKENFYLEKELEKYKNYVGNSSSKRLQYQGSNFILNQNNKAKSPQNHLSKYNRNLFQQKAKSPSSKLVHFNFQDPNTNINTNKNNYKEPILYSFGDHEFRNNIEPFGSNNINMNFMKNKNYAVNSNNVNNYEIQATNFNNNLNFTQKNHSLSSSSQRQQQRIKQIASYSNEDFLQFNINSNNASSNMINKKKNTHSFHHQSKNLQDVQIIAMKQKLSQYELVLKQKDLRILELENTILDHLQSSSKWKRSESQRSSASSNITGYQSLNSQQSNPQILHMKIKNLKTLLKQSKKQCQNYKKLYQNLKLSNENNKNKRQGFSDPKIGDDLISNTSKSMCVSDNTTIKNNQRHYQNITTNKDLQILNINPKQYEYKNSPFIQISQSETTIQKSRNILQQQSPSTISLSSNKQPIISILSNFILMSWSLKQIISKFCTTEINIQKINQNARLFLQELKRASQAVFKKVYSNINESEFSHIKEIWFI